jgi:diphthine-ammonia ligase
LRVGVLYTGGKDSTFTLHKTLWSGQDVKVLCTVSPTTRYPMLYHAPYTELVDLHSRAYGIPLCKVRGGDDELGTLDKLLSKCIEEYMIEGIATGALLSDYQRIRFTMKAAEKGVWIYNPIWRKDQEEYMRMLVRMGFKFIITRITAMGIPHRLLGKVIDEHDVEEIIRLSKKYGFNPAFEGGEAETLVVDAPLMKKRLVVEGDAVRESDYEASFLIKKVFLEDKQAK